MKVVGIGDTGLIGSTAVRRLTPGCVESDTQLAARFVRDALPLRDALFRKARWLTRCEADAEDLLQDTLLHAFAGFRSFEAGTNLNAWMFRILHNRWISSYRRRQRRPAEVPVDTITDRDLAGSASHQSAEVGSAEAEALAAYPDAALHAAWVELPEGFRTALYYADALGYTYAETSALLGIPIGTVMSRTSRGRERLRAALGGTRCPGRRAA